MPIDSTQRDTRIPVNRALVGSLALGCLLAATALWLAYGDAGRESNAWLWMAGFTRVGLLLSAFWLALPTRSREAAWAGVSPRVLIGALAAIVLVALRPRVALFLLPVALVIAVLAVVLRPRSRYRPERRG